MTSETMTGTRQSYVLITPARNEAAFIEKTIQSVIAQTAPPLRWVIVSDGSTDGTDKIVGSYLGRYPWIELVRMPERKERHFAGKVLAFNVGYARVHDVAYRFIANLDADVSFEPDYLEYLLGMFGENPKLGLAGTNYYEQGLKYDYRFSNIEDVAGACQLFRRECFEQIGGYKPNKDGGVDLFATLAARMHGWQTRSFTDKHFVHHRPAGTASISRFLVEVYNGRRDYSFGCHPLWELVRAAYRATRKPWVIGSFLLLVGYYWAMVTRRPKSVSEEIAQFRRLEQMKRLRRFLGRLLGRSSALPSEVRHHPEVVSNAP